MSKDRKLRLSYTLLNLWDRGDVQGAVDTYLHLDKPMNQAVIEGREIHEQIAEYIDKHNCFPEWLFKYDLITPETEKEVIVSYNDLFDLKCYMDCYDMGTETLFEFKTGVSDSLNYTRTWQLPLYFLIGELASLPIKSGILVHHNQHTKTTDYTVMHNNKETKDLARNIIDSIGPEIRDYFLQEGLI